MVTCKLDSQVAVPKMNSVRTRKPSSSNSSGFRLLDGDHLETSSSVSRNSVYKLKIDLMFDDTRSIRSNRLDDPRGSHRTRSIIMYGRSELASTAGESSRSITSFLQESNQAAKMLADSTQKDVQRISNSVQAQIEQLFTDVAKDATSSFAVTCLGSLPLKDKVTSLQGLQEPLRQLYLNEMANEKQNSGFLDICTTGLRVKITNTNSTTKNNNNNSNDGNVTPFHNIAVWSAVKFVVSEEEGGAAFLPLITDPENIDKSSLFQPLSTLEQKRVASSTHAPIFAVVMRSAGVPKVLECHGFICKSTEDAIVIAATLYQSLMAHVSSNSRRSTGKRRTPRNQNGVSCISIASSSAMTGSNYLSRSQIIAAASSNGRKNSFRSSSGSVAGNVGGAPTPSRSVRKKRVSNSSLSSSSNVINEAAETTTEERKRKSHKTKRAPPVPLPSVPGTSTRVDSLGSSGSAGCKAIMASSEICDASHGYQEKEKSHNNGKSSHRNHQYTKKILSDAVHRGTSASDMMDGNGGIGGGSTAMVAAASASGGPGGSGIRSDMNGDILTRVAIPRSGSFLNTGGLTRYKSRAARRHSDKLGGGGGGGSPLGFSELFNEFRLHENLHSLDDILYAIIDADGMSFNDLKPIYKEFLLKLAVTLTKDELFQRSKNIMRRQKKKKSKRKSNSTGTQKKPKTLIFGTKSLKKVFQLGQFRSCRGKPPKPPRNKELESKQTKSGAPLMIGPPTAVHSHHHQQHQQRSRGVATSGSDVSVVRNEHAFHGLNRNSSSGYVSCSECSYDSEACTCISADRCYCSLRADQINNKLRRKNERNAGMSKKSVNKQTNQIIYTPGSNANRHSLISCKSDDKCYCSMVEEEPNVAAEEDDEVANTQSDTTWCDTDSCVSASKCYCKRTERRLRPPNGSDSEHSQQRRQSRSGPTTARKPSEKLALDYELFTINGNGKSMQPHEALSVKKSVEAAAIFADVKLSQTTDIKSLCPESPAPTSAEVGHQNHNKNNNHNNSKKCSSTDKSGGGGGGSCRSYVSGSSKNNASKKRESYSIDRRTTEQRANSLVAISSSSSQKSCSADDLLSKLNAIEKAVGHQAASIRSSSSKNRELLSHFGASARDSAAAHSNYQSMRVVSASLEDTLGYLP